MSVVPPFVAAFERVDIPLDPDDHAAEAKLRERFKGFVQSLSEDHRLQFDLFVSRTPASADVRFERIDCAAVSGWWCRPRESRSGAAILYLHGGGYVRGSASAYRNFASHIAAGAGIAIFLLEYPLAPEAMAPAPIRKVVEALQWLTDNRYELIALAGDSAGGGLALGVLSTLEKLALRSVVACVAFSPWTDLSLSGASIDNPDIDDPLLSREAIAQSAATYVGNLALTDPRVSPLFGSSAITTPLFIQVGSDEILLDDAQVFARNAAARGAPVQLEIWAGLHHVFQLDLADLKSSRRALEHAARAFICAFDVARARIVAMAPNERPPA